MHLLPCPRCQYNIPVSLSQAGDEIQCNGCDASISIPKLGDLRKLPLADEPTDFNDRSKPAEENLGGRILMSILGVIGVLALVITAFCALQWALTVPEADTEQHIAEFKAQVERNTPAVLILEYENMEKGGLDAATPYLYKTVANKRREWGINALAAGAIMVLSFLGCVFLATTGRSS